MKPKSTVIGLLLCFVKFIASASDLELGYNVIEQTGKFCPGRDTCQTGRSTRGPEGVENDWKKRNCFCDNACSVYGDCCIDAKTYVQAEQQVNHLSFECGNLKQYGDIYMRNKCSPNYQVDESIKQACEAPRQGLQNGDPFGSTPVTSLSSGFTYKNYYCAVCNNDSIDSDIRFWRPRLECPTLTSYNNRFKNLTHGYIESNIFVDNDGRWGVNIDTNGVNVFHECTVDPAVPDTLIHMIRSCSGKATISSCPQEYNYVNATIVELCSSYTAMVFEPNAAYRNVHCAICNNASLDKLICLNLGPFGRFNWQQNFNSFSFAVLFDISGQVSDKVGYANKCKSGELFDPFFKKCRNVICGHDGMEYRSGKCINTRIPNTTTHSPPAAATDSQSSTQASTTRFAFTPTTTTTATTKDKEDELFEEEKVITTTEIELLDETSTEETEKEIIITDSEIPPPLLPPQPSITDSSVKIDDAAKPFKDCPKFELQVGEFRMNETEHSVYLEKYDKVLQEGEFSMNGDNLVICVTSELEESSIKFGPQMGYVTFVCLGISILCLSLHIIASLITSELQNLSGKNLLSLSVALLGGYVTFISAMFNNSANAIGCQVIATAMYFFYLSSFFWMMVIAFDVCKTLKMATTQLRLTTGSQWRKFALYSTFAWGMPIALVTIVTLLDHMDAVPKDYRPGFGATDLCWFSNKMALLIYFAVPFTGIMGLNIFLFVFSACMVYDTTKATSKMATSCSPSKINFQLYLRLAVIMGLTWIIGLAAGFVDQEPVWYVFVGLNTLQGLFIFVAFTCSKKVVNGVRESCFSRRRESRSLPNNVVMGTAGVGGRIRGLDEDKWKFSTSSTSTSRNATKKSHLDSSSLGSSGTLPTPSVIESAGVGSGQPPVDSIPSRYGPRSKTMYTVSKQQVSGVTQNSFNGRYY